MNDMNDAYVIMISIMVATWKVWLSGIVVGALAIWFINRNYTE